MNAGRGWTVALALAWTAGTARAQVDAGRDAADTGAAGDADSGPGNACNLNSSFPGDEQCILPPAAGFQVHYGPRRYDDPNAVGSYVLEPGSETVECLFLKTPNTAPLYTREFRFGARPALFDASLWQLPASRPDSVIPEACGALDGAVPLVFARQTTADVTLSDAPENAGLAWQIDPGTQVAIRVHSLNVTAEPALAEAWLNVVAADASTVTERLEGLDLHARGQAVPPAIQVVHAFSCPAPGELRLVEVAGVVSSAVNEIAIRVRRADGSKEPIYDSFEWQAPAALRYDSVTANAVPDAASRRSGGASGVLLVHPGDALEWDCTIQNTTPQALSYGSDLFANVACDVRGVVTGSNGNGWTCVDDRNPQDAGADGASPGSGGRASTPDAGAGAGGRGVVTGGRDGTGGGSGASASGGRTTVAPDGGVVSSAASGGDTGGCNCRTSYEAQRAGSRFSAVSAALLGLALRRRRRRRPHGTW